MSQSQPHGLREAFLVASSVSGPFLGLFYLLKPTSYPRHFCGDQFTNTQPRKWVGVDSHGVTLTVRDRS